MAWRAPAAPGFTLLELVIVVAIVGILASAALPLARWSIKRQREYELQQSLRILRNAIDQYHDLALAGLIDTDGRSGGYPPDLEVLVDGVELRGELPEVLPGVSDEYAASGPGLLGGYSGAATDAVPVAGPAASGGRLPSGVSVSDFVSGAGQAGASGVRGAGARGAQPGSRGLPATSGRLQLGQSGERGGGERQGSLFFAARDGSLLTFRFGSSFGREESRDTEEDRPLGPDGRPLRVIFLRRLPIDPFTGKAEWGLRCYGEKPDDRLWCGRNVFDVYSRAAGRGIDGRPYQEW